MTTYTSVDHHHVAPPRPHLLINASPRRRHYHFDTTTMLARQCRQLPLIAIHDHTSDISLALPLRPPQPRLESLTLTMTTICYIGESPDDDDNCPSFLPLFPPPISITRPENMKTGIGKHLHECAALLKHSQAQLSTNEAFKPSHCLWDGCSKASTIWETRDAHLKHLENHIAWLASISITGDSRHCKWDLCKEPSHTDWFLSDWAFHFATAHGINSNKAVIVDHCALCGDWVEDQKGDCSAWNAHCKTHYKTNFSPFKHRLQGHVSHHDCKLKITNAVAEYEPNAPFDNKRPLLHGHIQQSIALHPFFCPFCVYDNDLLMYMCMKQ
ncbi:hypothetical protein EDD85DRAFT_948568 [Armillaria nabsnona]|nr:hypothetical protein EDD85DRAFT_948568 [Armillaria nabsnona]